MNDALTTIDDVLAELDRIIDETVRENCFLGIFAYIYRRTTAQIKAEVEKGAFKDNERMARFDVEFARLYIDAYHGYYAGETISRSWKVAFDARNRPLTIVQHLTLGMNTHINLDLGVAASKIMEGDDILKLKEDYYKVNEVLAGLIDEMQDRVGRVSRLMFLVDWLGRRTDERLINFSISKARNESWKVARALASLKGEARTLKLEETDLIVSRIGELVISPKGRLIRQALRLVRFFETRDIGKIIRNLRN